MSTTKNEEPDEQAVEKMPILPLDPNKYNRKTLCLRINFLTRVIAESAMAITELLNRVKELENKIK